MRSASNDTGDRPWLAVCWDMDGTLADSEPLHQRTLIAVLREAGVEVDDALLHAVIGTTERDVHALCSRLHALEIGFDDWASGRNRHYAREVRQLRARAGAREAYEALAARGVPQAIVSNSLVDVLDLTVAALGLRPAPATIVSRDQVPFGKPDPAPYLLAAARLGLPPQQVLVVEDSPVGATAGLAAGMTVLAWPAPGLEHTPFPAGCRLIASAAALADFLASNVAGALDEPA